MSFILELDAPDVDPETAERLERATEEAGYLPVSAARRRRWRRRSQLGLSIRDRRDNRAPRRCQNPRP
jgi:DNA-binding LacI/PurR family transcriptional regulator